MVFSSVLFFNCVTVVHANCIWHLAVMLISLEAQNFVLNLSCNMYHVILFTVLNINYNYFHIKPLFTILYICHHWGHKINRTWWYILHLLEDYLTVRVDDPIWSSSVFMAMQIYISKVYMSHSVMFLNILELNDVITSKVFICIVAVLMGRPHSCLVAHTPELFKKWHWNFHAWALEMFYRLSVLCLVIVLFVFSSTTCSFLWLGISVPHNGCWFFCM